MLTQQSGAAARRKNVSCCRKVTREIIRHDIVVEVCPNNVLFQRGLIAREQKWKDWKMVHSARGETTIGTEHLRSDEWKGDDRVVGQSLNQTWHGFDVTLETYGERSRLTRFSRQPRTRIKHPRRKTTSTERATRGTRDEKVAKAVMAPLIISQDGAVHIDTVGIRKDCPRYPRGQGTDGTVSMRYNLAVVGISMKGSRVSDA